MKTAQGKTEKSFREFVSFTVAEFKIELLTGNFDFRVVADDLLMWFEGSDLPELDGATFAAYLKRAVTFLRQYADKIRAAEAEILASLQ